MAQPEANSNKVNFSKVKYHQVASSVGLDHASRFADAPSFDLHRSRIPTPIFKSIVEEMDVKLTDYGDLRSQLTEEARSRFFSPVSTVTIPFYLKHLVNINQIFDYLGAQFGGWFRDTPEMLMRGRITTKGRVEYQFMTFSSSLAILFIEVKLNIKNRLDAISQVIAECDGTV